MELERLLLGIEKCKCGRRHPCPIKHVIIRRGAIDALSEIVEKYNNILLVADENTYRAAGERVINIIGERVTERVIFDGARILVPNEDAIERILASVTDKTDLILGVGSGVINDLCKHTSFTAGLPYHIVATAPSMDGYASKGAALILGGMKVTLNADTPEAIIADTDVLSAAPMDMIIAGYGDIIGKYSCLSDWKLSALVNGEYLCETVLGATYEEVEKTRGLAGGIRDRAPDAIGTLMGALVSVGILMAYVGNSRPASGSEHHLSHYFEIVGIVKNEPYLPHGIDVFYSAAETARLREELLATDFNKATVGFDRARYEADIRRIYGSVADEVIALQDKLGWYSVIEKRLSVYRERECEIKALLRDAPSFDEMRSMLAEVGMDYDDFVKTYGEKKIRDARLYAKDLKDRYTVLWLYSDLL